MHRAVARRGQAPQSRTAFVARRSSRSKRLRRSFLRATSRNAQDGRSSRPSAAIAPRFRCAPIKPVEAPAQVISPRHIAERTGRSLGAAKRRNRAARIRCAPVKPVEAPAQVISLIGIAERTGQSLGAVNYPRLRPEIAHDRIGNTKKKPAALDRLLMLKTGFEPVRIAPRDFKSPASAVSPLQPMQLYDTQASRPRRVSATPRANRRRFLGEAKRKLMPLPDRAAFPAHSAQIADTFRARQRKPRSPTTPPRFSHTPRESPTFSGRDEESPAPRPRRIPCAPRANRRRSPGKTKRKLMPLPDRAAAFQPHCRKAPPARCAV